MDIVIYIVVAIVCLAVGFLISRVMIKNNANSAISVAEAKVADAKREAETIKKEAAIEAKDEALKIKQKAEDEVHKQSRDIQQREDRLQQREDSIDRRSDSLDKREHQISSLQGQVEKMHDDLQSKIEGADKKLLQVAAMSREEAREQVLSTVKEDCVAEAAGIIRDVEARTKAEADKRSREILSVAIQRMAADYTAERTVTSVSDSRLTTSRAASLAGRAATSARSSR